MTKERREGGREGGGGAKMTKERRKGVGGWLTKEKREVGVLLDKGKKLGGGGGVLLDKGKKLGGGGGGVA